MQSLFLNENVDNNNVAIVNLPKHQISELLKIDQKKSSFFSLFSFHYAPLTQSLIRIEIWNASTLMSHLKTNAFGNNHTEQIRECQHNVCWCRYIYMRLWKSENHLFGDLIAGVVIVGFSLFFF